VTNSRLVYSTDDGDRRRRGKDRPAKPSGPQLPQDGVVRVFRDKGRRGGKTVVVVRGLPAGDLAAVAADLKKLCGAGGSVKDGAVEIQGDHREKVAGRLTAQGYTVKLAGG
jgi:translation initiation factor 1